LSFRKGCHPLFLADQIDEPNEEIMGGFRARGVFRVALYRKAWFANHAQAAPGPIKTRYVGFIHMIRHAVGPDSETMVQRCDFDFASGVVLHRMIGAMMSLMHLFGLCTKR